MRLSGWARQLQGAAFLPGIGIRAHRGRSNAGAVLSFLGAVDAKALVACLHHGRISPTLRALC